MKPCFTPTRVALLLTALWTIGGGAIFWWLSPGELPKQLNEWGDFLAGFFAPVAFVWLVTAVWIQSHELKAQRAELELTRTEMKEQRAVMQAQAVEAKNQAAYIGTQTAILQNEEKRRNWEDADDLFRALINRLINMIRLPNSPWNFHNQGTAIILVNSPNLTDDFDYMAHIASQLVDQYHNNSVVKINTPIHCNNPDRFNRVTFEVKHCINSLPTTSPAMQARASAMRLDEIDDYSERLRKLTTWS